MSGDSPGHQVVKVIYIYIFGIDTILDIINLFTHLDDNKFVSCSINYDHQVIIVE